MCLAALCKNACDKAWRGCAQVLKACSAASCTSSVTNGPRALRARLCPPLAALATASLPWPSIAAPFAAAARTAADAASAAEPPPVAAAIVATATDAAVAAALPPLLGRRGPWGGSSRRARGVSGVSRGDPSPRPNHW